MIIFAVILAANIRISERISEAEFNRLVNDINKNYVGDVMITTDPEDGTTYTNLIFSDSVAKEKALNVKDQYVGYVIVKRVKVEKK